MAKTGYGNFVLKFVTPWRGTTHQWSVASSHSGGSFSTEGDIIAFLQSVAEIIMSFIASGSTTYLSEVLYYDGIHSATLYGDTFTSQSAANSAGYLTSWIGQAYTTSSDPPEPLSTTMAPYEACVMLEAPVGLSTTGKPVTMKKFIHSCASPTGETDGVPGFATSLQTWAVRLGNGYLYGSRVLVSPKGKQGTWACLLYYGNHQAARRRKKASS